MFSDLFRHHEAEALGLDVKSYGGLSSARQEDLFEEQEHGPAPPEQHDNTDSQEQVEDIEPIGVGGTMSKEFRKAKNWVDRFVKEMLQVDEDEDDDDLIAALETETGQDTLILDYFLADLFEWCVGKGIMPNTFFTKLAHVIHVLRECHPKILELGGFEFTDTKSIKHTLLNRKAMPLLLMRLSAAEVFGREHSTTTGARPLFSQDIDRLLKANVFNLKFSALLVAIRNSRNASRGVEWVNVYRDQCKYNQKAKTWIITMKSSKTGIRGQKGEDLVVELSVEDSVVFSSYMEQLKYSDQRYLMALGNRYRLFYNSVISLCQAFNRAGRLAGYPDYYFGSHSPRAGAHNQTILQKHLDEGMGQVEAGYFSTHQIGWKNPKNGQVYARTDELDLIHMRAAKKTFDELTIEELHPDLTSGIGEIEKPQRLHSNDGVTLQLQAEVKAIADKLGCKLRFPERFVSSLQDIADHLFAHASPEDMKTYRCIHMERQSATLREYRKERASQFTLHQSWSQAFKAERSSSQGRRANPKQHRWTVTNLMVRHCLLTSKSEFGEVQVPPNYIEALGRRKKQGRTSQQPFGEDGMPLKKRRVDKLCRQPDSSNKRHKPIVMVPFKGELAPEDEEFFRESMKHRRVVKKARELPNMIMVDMYPVGALLRRYTKGHGEDQSLREEVGKIIKINVSERNVISYVVQYFMWKTVTSKDDSSGEYQDITTDNLEVLCHQDVDLFNFDPLKYAATRHKNTKHKNARAKVEHIYIFPVGLKLFQYHGNAITGVFFTRKAHIEAIQFTLDDEVYTVKFEDGEELHLSEKEVTQFLL